MAGDGRRLLSGKQLRALELDLAGVPTKEIARQVNVVVGTVRNWRVWPHPYAVELARMMEERWEEFQGRMTTLASLALNRVEVSLGDQQGDVGVALKFLGSFGRQVLENRPPDTSIKEMVLGTPVREDRLASWKMALQASTAADPVDGTLNLDEFAAAAATSLRASCLALCQTDGERFRALLDTPADQQQAAFEKAAVMIESDPSPEARPDSEDQAWLELEVLAVDLRDIVPHLLLAIGEHRELEPSRVTETRAALERDLAKLKGLWPGPEEDDLEPQDAMEDFDPNEDPMDDFDIHDPETCLSVVQVSGSLLLTIARMTLP